MEFLLADIFFWIVGWIYMVIKYPNKAKRIATLKSKYSDSYNSIGREKSLKVMLGFFLILIIAFIIAVIYGSIKYP